PFAPSFPPPRPDHHVSLAPLRTTTDIGPFGRPTPDVTGRPTGGWRGPLCRMIGRAQGVPARAPTRPAGSPHPLSPRGAGGAGTGAALPRAGGSASRPA